VRTLSRAPALCYGRGGIYRILAISKTRNDMASLQPVRGTHDLLPEAMRGYRHVVDTARRIVERYGFDEVATPIFEFSQVFKRTLGEASDVVTKEMYSFTDKGDEEITLRPENTAGVARAFISEGLAQQTPVRYFYAGPMFRYERPQKGRQRQFHQIGVELIGLPQPQADVEVIAAGVRVLEALGVLGETVLQLNTLGDTESRTVYREALVTYFEKHRERLSEDSQARLERNPLRILDSKDETDRGIVAGAPLFGDFLNEDSTAFFDTVKAGLDALGIEYTVNPRLVRGLDYYCHTAFEFVTTALGAQGTVLAGGRYDGLIKMMGGPDTPGVGWAAGVERLSMLCGDVPDARRPVALIPLGSAAEQEIFKIAEQLRGTGFRIELGYSGNLGRRMKRANRVNAVAAVIVGDDELARGTATVRNMESGSQDEVALASLEEHLAVYR
jgi:histidyl-tRNA synthetase